MKYVLVLWVVCFSVMELHAQVSAQGQVRPSVSLSIMPTFQHWNDNGDIYEEMSIPVGIFVRFNRKLSVRLASNRASASGKNLENLAGFTDTQVGVNYELQASKASLVLSLGLNLPSGKKELTDDELGTSFVFSRPFFRFQVPNFGQGFSVSPGLTLAIPLGEHFVLGLGGTYRIRRPYKPLSKPLADFTDPSLGLEGDYKPGNELLVTGGVDVFFNRITSFSVDVIYTRYRPDVIGKDDIFGSGDRLVLNAQFRKYFGFTELWLFARYGNKAKNETLQMVMANDTLMTLEQEGLKSIPDQFEFRGHLRLRYNQKIYIRFLVESRIFEKLPLDKKSSFTDYIRLFGFGVAPQVVLSRKVSIPLRLKFFRGTFTGYEAAVGLAIRL